MSIHLKNNRNLWWLLLPVAVLVHSCAQIVPLSGGDKDVVAPIEQESYPANGSTNFSDKEVSITFDEFIRLKNLQQQLIVSPLMDPAPEVLVKGKKLVIKIKSELKENTTYSLNFGTAIEDITEGNAIPNYKYVFSTGDYLDSLSISGQVVDAFKLEAMDGMYVMLYDQMEDSVPSLELPRYITRADENGNYTISNIAGGSYKLFALGDMNSNYLFDLPNEAIGFEIDPITIDSSVSSHKIAVFTEEIQKQYISKVEHRKYGRLDIVFNQPTKDLSVTSLNHQFKKAWFIEEKNKSGDTLTYWFSDLDGLDSLSLLFKDGAEVIDTIAVGLIPRSEFKDSTLYLMSNLSEEFDLNKAIQFKASRPVVNYVEEDIVLFEDSVQVKAKIEFRDKAMRKLNLIYPFKENTAYRVEIPPKSIEDYLGLFNDTIRMSFKTKRLSHYGNVKLSVNSSYDEQLLLQLITGQETVVQQDIINGKAEIDYSFLQPGDYQLKVIVDSNKNGKWDTGDYYNKIKPEKVVIYPQAINVRSNWDQELDWKISR